MKPQTKEQVDEELADARKRIAELERERAWLRMVLFGIQDSAATAHARLTAEAPKEGG